MNQMQKQIAAKEAHMKTPKQDVLNMVYGETEKQQKRYEHLSQMYTETFGTSQMEFFTAPGRTEIIGNHVDHNGGKVLAASIDMDTIGAAYPNDSQTIEIVSEGYPDRIIIDLEQLDGIHAEGGTASLVAGMAKAVKEFGYRIGGFQAYVTTDVISSAGVSSSASFEMLFCSMVNFFFNSENRMSPITYAKIGQFAENRYWGKASGLMDQMACAVGGTILLDFKDDVTYEKVNFDFDRLGYRLIIINTGKGHADLSREYSEVPEEMSRVAGLLGCSRLCETNLETLCGQLPEIGGQLANDRAVLRAIHFFEENERVADLMHAIDTQDTRQILQLITKSGDSSWKLLQNCYAVSDYREQKVALTLALTELFLKRIGDGCCRVHGGGFAGVIMSVIPMQFADAYTQYISAYVGADAVYPMHIRQIGAIHLEK